MVEQALGAAPKLPPAALPALSGFPSNPSLELPPEKLPAAPTKSQAACLPEEAEETFLPAPAAKLPALLLPWEQAVTTCLTAQLILRAARIRPRAQGKLHRSPRDQAAIPLSPQLPIYTLPRGC